MAATASHIYFPFPFWWHIAIKNVKSICILNFDNVAQSAAAIILFAVSENKRPPYWNSTSGFDFDVFAVIACDSALPYQILCKLNDRRRSYGVTRWRPLRRKFTSCFWFGRVWHLGRSEAIGLPNFDQISQSTAEILLYFRFPFWLFWCHPRVILRRHAKFHPNRTVSGRFMTS